MGQCRYYKRGENTEASFALVRNIWFICVVWFILHNTPGQCGIKGLSSRQLSPLTESSGKGKAGCVLRNESGCTRGARFNRGQKEWRKGEASAGGER